MSGCESATTTADAIWLSVMFFCMFGFMGYLLWLASR